MNEKRAGLNDDLVELVDKLIDGRIVQTEVERLKEMLLAAPEALNYCAERMRWSAELGSALDGFEVEVTEARRVVLRGRGHPRELVRNEAWQSPPLLGSPERRWLPRRPAFWWIFALSAAVLVVLGFIVAKKMGEPKLVLRNADFEQADLSNTLEPFNTSVLDWEDFFRADMVGTCNLERFTEGQIRARSGQNVVRMKDGWMMQRLKMSDDSPVRVARGLRIRVKAWAHLGQGVPFGEMRFALRVVESTYPRMRQFEVAQDFARLESPGWRQVEADLWITERDLIMAHTFAHPPDSPQDPVTLEGKSLTLIIENRSGTEFFIDDVSAEIVPDGGGMKPFSFETPSTKAVNTRFDFWTAKSEGKVQPLYGVRAGETWLPPGRTQFAPPFHGEQVGFVNVDAGQVMTLDSVPVGKFGKNEEYELRLALRPDDTTDGVKIDYQVGFVSKGKEVAGIASGQLDPAAAEESEVVLRLKLEDRGGVTDGAPFGIRLKFTAQENGRSSRVYFDNLRMERLMTK